MGLNATAMITAAATVRNEFDREPTAVPMPITMAT
jgi:hypothetical protein